MPRKSKPSKSQQSGVQPEPQTESSQPTFYLEVRDGQGLISTDYVSVLPPSKRVESLYLVGLGVREPYDGAVPLGASTFCVDPEPMGETQSHARQIVTSRDLEHALANQSAMLTTAISGRASGLRSRGISPSAMESDEFIAELASYAYSLAQSSLGAIKSAEAAVDVSGPRLERLVSRSEELLADKTVTQTPAEVTSSALASVYISRLKELKARHAYDEHMAVVNSYRELSALRDVAREHLPKEIVEQHRFREFWVEELLSTAEWLEYGAQQYLEIAKVISEEVGNRTEEERTVCKGKASRQKLDELETNTLEDLRRELEAFCLVTEVGRAQEEARLKAAAATRASKSCVVDRSHFGGDDDNDDDDDDADFKEVLQPSREPSGTAEQDATRRAESLRTNWEPSPSETTANSRSEWVTVLRKSTSRSRSGLILSRVPAWDQENHEPRHAHLYRDLKIGWNRFTSRASLPDPHFAPVPLLRGSSQLVFPPVRHRHEIELERGVPASGERGADRSHRGETSRWFWARLRGEEWLIASLLGNSRSLARHEHTFDSLSDPGADLREDQSAVLEDSTNATIHAHFDWGKRTMRRVSSFDDLPKKKEPSWLGE